jgi:hypothetical protein
MKMASYDVRGEEHLPGRILGRDGPHGRPVQVDPINPTVKAPGTKRWKLRYDEPPSNFAFKFNVHHYTMVPVEGVKTTILMQLKEAGKVSLAKAGRCRLNR